MIEYARLNDVTEQYTVDLGLLYPETKQRNLFDQKWPDFFASDAANTDVLQVKGDKLIYLSERLIPDQVDARPPALLVLGNPAPHSIKNGMFFSFEGNGREHRIWKAFRETGLIDFGHADDLPLDQKNTHRRHQLLNLDYASVFRIGLLPYFSFPTTSSAPPWTGVSGVQRLFGKEAFEKIRRFETTRVSSEIAKFMTTGPGVVLSFQRDAYEGLKSVADPGYARDAATEGRLVGSIQDQPQVVHYGMPPTRLIHSTNTKDLIRKIISSHL